ncbi:coiled-coil domain-containing protein AGAP005037 isoform X2 [Ctenocephalides felis]|uniref:coiled-coil domain-containing protein AGAP005037 isoform X2 n=1 Tax=Ctenocephalides felis TaxID=7515 RepID=UPI000E6E1F58|nr:coiled-coil domain-containing protein AGAP005037 isoform X2 [Ctenocephalides felis]
MSDKVKKRGSGIRKIFPVSLFSKTRSPSENGKPETTWADRSATSKTKPIRRIVLEPSKDVSDIKVVRRFGNIDVPRQPSMNLEDQVERMQRELEIVSNDKTSNLYSGPLYNKDSKPKSKIPNSSSSSSSTLISDSSDTKPQLKQISRLKKPTVDFVNRSTGISTSGRNSAPIFSTPGRTMQISRLPKLNSSAPDKRTESPLNFLDTKSKIPSTKIAAKPRPVAIPNADKIINESGIKSKPVPATRNFEKRATSFNVNHKMGYQPNRNVTDDSKAFEGVSAEMKITKAPVVYNTSKLRTRSLSPRQRHKLDGSKVPTEPSDGMQLLPDKEFGDDIDKDVGDYAKLKNLGPTSDGIKSPQACSTPEKSICKQDGEKHRKIGSPIPAPTLPPRDMQKVQTRQNVEAFCWKKLQEMNKRNEEQIYANCFDRFNSLRSLTPPVVPPHAIDPIYVSRSEIGTKAQPQIDQKRRQIIPAPIFKRGSLVSESDLVNPLTPKRVSFTGGNVSPRIPLGLPVRRIVTVNDKVCDVYGRIHEVPKGSDDYIRNPQLRRPLPPVPARAPCDSESGSEAGEVQRIMQYGNQRHPNESDWAGRHATDSVEVSRGGRGSRQSSRSREDPRRHTLGGDMLYQQQMLPQRALDLEAPPTRGYAPLGLGAAGPLFDDDPGIMSEVETASTGFRRGGKQRSSLPVVRTPSKTLERPLGLVFLQYRNETKRALLPNEITSIDTVRALFVRSFPRQLTMAYLEGPHVKIYIHDSSKDMFYELEDLRSHLRDIRDRSVLRLFESAEVSGACPGVGVGGMPVGPPGSMPVAAWGDADQSYFSEPEFDSEYRHQHVHKSKAGKGGGAPYYVGGSSTLPRLGGYDRKSLPPSDGYMSSPERGAPRGGGYEEPYYSQYGTRAGTVTPVIDEEVTEPSLLDEGYSLYGVKLPPGGPRSSARPPSAQPYDPPRHSDELHRMRVEHMERQLANLTGLVQKALTQAPGTAPQAAPREFLQVPGGQGYTRDKSVSFEKSVSFSDEPPGISPKQHSPQHSADSRPAKPAIKSSTLPRTSSQERDRLKPLPPPKPMGLAPQAGGAPMYRGDLILAPEVYNHLRGLQKKAKDLRTEVRTLRRMSQAQALAVREDIRDAFIRIRATLLAGGASAFRQTDQDKMRLTREEELYKQEVLRLESDLSELEGSVETLRGEVINRRTRVNMSAVEDMALVLSRASKTVAELKMRFPSLQQGLRVALAGEMEQVVREEKFLKEEPERLESALRRCKKLTGTLVTLKRLASVQEQRLPPPAGEAQGESPPPTTPTSAQSKSLYMQPNIFTVCLTAPVPE